jgi:predicted kinase
MKQKLIVMVGVPASGKSTKGQQIAEDNNFAYVSRDFIRTVLDLGHGKAEEAITKKVFLGFVEAALLRGDTVVADATHLNVDMRAPLIDLGARFEADNIALVMNTSYETCVLRNAQRNEDSQIPANKLRKMNEMFRKPHEAEGFKNVYFYNEGEEEKWN